METLICAGCSRSILNGEDTLNHTDKRIKPVCFWCFDSTRNMLVKLIRTLEEKKLLSKEEIKQVFEAEEEHKG